MRLHDASFMNYHEGDTSIYCHIEDNGGGCVLVSFNGDAESPYQTPAVKFFLSEKRVLALKNSMLEAYERYVREKKEDGNG